MNADRPPSSSTAAAADESICPSTTPLLVSDGTPFVPKPSYPQFNWSGSGSGNWGTSRSVVPRYFQFRHHSVLTPQQVRSIAARSDFVCIEKLHGWRQHGESRGARSPDGFSANEESTRHEATAFHEIDGPGHPGRVKVLFYFNSVFAWPYTSSCRDFRPGAIDDRPDLRSMLVTDPTNAQHPYLDGRRKVYCFDVLNPKFREWWVDTVVEAVRYTGCDGVFVDQMHGVVYLRRDRREAIERAMGTMMSILRARLGPDKIVLGNNASRPNGKHVIDYVDAIMIEYHCPDELSRENLLRDWTDMTRVAKMGKMTVFVVNVDRCDADRPEDDADLPAFAADRLEFYLACYLMGAEPYC